MDAFFELLTEIISETAGNIWYIIISIAIFIVSPPMGLVEIISLYIFDGLNTVTIVIYAILAISDYTSRKYVKKGKDD